MSDDVNQGFGAGTPSVDLEALRAQAAALVGGEDTAGLLAAFVAEERAKRDALLKEKAIELVPPSEGTGDTDSQGFPKQYVKLVVFAGQNKTDLQYITPSINGYALKIPRGPVVIVPEVFAQVLDHAVEEVTTKSQGGLETRPAHRFPFNVIGPATEAEYKAFRAVEQDKLKHAAA